LLGNGSVNAFPKLGSQQWKDIRWWVAGARHVPAATNRYAVIEELLEAVTAVISQETRTRDYINQSKSRIFSQFIKKHNEVPMQGPLTLANKNILLMSSGEWGHNFSSFCVI
jgi:hypothetical protein